MRQAFFMAITSFLHKHPQVFGTQVVFAAFGLIELYSNNLILLHLMRIADRLCRFVGSQSYYRAVRLSLKRRHEYKPTGLSNFRHDFLTNH